LFRLAVQCDGNQEPIARQPWTRRGCLASKLQRRGIHPIRRAAQREFAQRQEIGLAEEPFGRSAHPVGRIHLACLQAVQQVVGRQVDQLDFIGFVEYPIRQRLLLADTRDAGDDVVQTLEMLNVERTPNADAGVQQLLDVLPALGMPWQRLALGNVRVCELIDEHDRGRASQSGVEIEFASSDAAVADLEQRQLLETLEQALGLDAPMGFDVGDDDIGAAGACRPGRFQHRVGLAHAGRGAEENSQPSAPRARVLPLDVSQQFVGIAARGLGHSSTQPSRSC
jgi:hypothetical protein